VWSQSNIAQDARRAEIEARAAELAEQRRLAKEEAKAYQDEVAAREADDVAQRMSRAEKAQDRKRRKDAGEDVGDEPRRKRGNGTKKGGKSRGRSELESSEEEASAGSEGAEGSVDRRRNTLEKIKADRRKVSVADLRRGDCADVILETEEEG
jgi:RNA polymerase-associated protein CTR9